MKRSIALALLLSLILVAPKSYAAAIDEIAYLASSPLSELSVKAQKIFLNRSLGFCGRRRELKITNRRADDHWPELIQSALKRSSAAKRSVRIKPVNSSSVAVEQAVRDVLKGAGYSFEIPSETSERVKDFIACAKKESTGLNLYSGTSTNVDFGDKISFLALADDNTEEVLMLTLGDELCR